MKALALYVTITLMVINTAHVHNYLEGLKWTITHAKEPWHCGHSKHECSNRHCVPLTSVCNGINDCGDNSDEVHCPLASLGICVPLLQFQCRNKRCISILNFCNGKDDCGDGSDEATCVMPHYSHGAHVPAVSTSKPSVTSTANVNGGQSVTTPTAKPSNVTQTETLTVRLVNGMNALDGRVEVLHNGVWGTVCDDGWDDDDAKVVCRMLGYDPATATHTSKARYGSGTGPIWLDETQCSGQETNLGQCRFVPIGHGDCDHSEDAGVICQTRKQTMMNSQTLTAAPPGGKWIVLG
ncbi:scavenger receptor cysteine-rich type 1 protein M130-like [Mizuhopecten yessoensis]|uniref:Galectin-3-binding protein A n=1 Tax=Mizuhopecten yessoensis TaxID=6573 RepID=A0A210R5A6_MIZYE|nr:scavenger receptor cysteine-rich type 1 protein M130-like [Mizuhopecten yessoensis]OWF56210.1 Galectin-3-binding protein A [Mizuhopecten yessoensis]